jgi:hypothetical protein
MRQPPSSDGNPIDRASSAQATTAAGSALTRAMYVLSTWRSSPHEALIGTAALGEYEHAARANIQPVGRPQRAELGPQSLDEGNDTAGAIAVVLDGDAARLVDGENCVIFVQYTRLRGARHALVHVTDDPDHALPPYQSAGRHLLEAWLGVILALPLELQHDAPCIDFSCPIR